MKGIYNIWFFSPYSSWPTRKSKTIQALLYQSIQGRWQKHRQPTTISTQDPYIFTKKYNLYVASMPLPPKNKVWSFYKFDIMQMLKPLAFWCTLRQIHIEEEERYDLHTSFWNHDYFSKSNAMETWKNHSAVLPR